MKLKHVFFGICLFFVNSSLCTFMSDIKNGALKTLGFTAKFVPCFYISTYISTLAHESGHALAYKLLFPDRKKPKIVIGAICAPLYPAYPYPNLKFLDQHIILGLNPLNGAYTDMNLRKEDLMNHPDKALCIYSAGALAGGLTNIINYKLVDWFLNKYLPNIAKSLRLPLTCCFILNFARNIGNLLPCSPDGYYIKLILDYKNGSNDRMQNFFNRQNR